VSIMGDEHPVRHGICAMQPHPGVYQRRCTCRDGSRYGWGSDATG
jgi:hypothetical protein